MRVMKIEDFIDNVFLLDDEIIIILYNVAAACLIGLPKKESYICNPTQINNLILVTFNFASIERANFQIDWQPV